MELLTHRLAVRIRSLLSHARFRPFDVSTPDGRASERHRRAALTVLALVLGRGVGVLTLLISVPLTLHYLGTERYGLWMALSSLLVLFNFADLGIGYGLLNMVASAHGRNDERSAAEAVSTAFFVLSSIALAIIGLFAVLYRLIDWGSLFNVQTELAVREAGPATAVFVLCFAANLPLGVVARVQLGYQEGFANSIWASVGNLLALGGVLLVICAQAGLPWLVLAMAGGPVVALALNGIVLFVRRRPWLRPRWSLVHRGPAQAIVRMGFVFFVLQAASALATSIDNFIITRTLGPAAVTEYAVPMSLFNLIPSMLSVLLTPLWPAYGEAITRGDHAWARKTFARSMYLSVGGAAALAALLLIFGGWIVRVWVNSRVDPPFALLLAAAAWVVVGSAWNPIAVFLSAAHRLRFQFIGAILMGTTALALKLLLPQHLGTPGVVWATVIAYSCFLVGPSILYVPRTVRELTPAAKPPSSTTP